MVIKLKEKIELNPQKLLKWSFLTFLRWYFKPHILILNNKKLTLIEEIPQ